MKWTCKACTWPNDNPVRCVMCSALRPRGTAPSGRRGAAPPNEAAGREEGGSNEIPSDKDPEIDEGDVASERVESTDDEAAPDRDDAGEMIDASREEDAFAKQLRYNNESSADEGSEDGGDEHHREANDDGDGREREQRWDAFQTLQSNYRSSDSSSDGESGHSTRGSDNNVECIDLIDSDDGSERENDANKNRRLDLVDSDQDDNPPQRRRLDRTPKRPSPIALDDSSISEEEGGAPPSSFQSPVRSRSGVKPAWMRSVPLKSAGSINRVSLDAIIGSNRQRISLKRSVTTLPRSSFTCMNGRNDVGGGSGAGINAFTVGNREGDDQGNRTSSKKTNASTTARGRTRKTTRSTKAKTTRAKSTNNNRATTADGDAATDDEPKRSRKRRYRRSKNPKQPRSRTTSSTRRANASGRGDNAWSARERGIIRTNNNSRPGTSTASTYMRIGKQESGLGSIGGATVSF